MAHYLALLFKKIFFIDVELIYKIMQVSGIQNSDSDSFPL